MRYWTLVAALGASLVAIGAGNVVLGDVIIHMKNGTTIRVPANNDDIAKIEFEEAAASKTPEATATPVVKPKPAPKPARSAGYTQDKITARDLANSVGGGKVVALPGASQFNDAALQGRGEQGKVLSIGRIISVGPGRDYERPSDAARDMKPGDTLEIEPGLYLNDFTVWDKDNITLRGIVRDGKRPHLRATTSPSNRKAIWVIDGRNVVVENIEFSGAAVRDRNGAGIRFQSGSLTVRNSWFHHNQMGLLTSNLETAQLTIENSEFSFRTLTDGLGHGLYVGRIGKVTVRNSYFHHNDIGHHLKSRARESYIYGNKIVDAADGGSSYLVDISNCGTTFLVGNVLQQGVNTENTNMIAYGSEGCGANPAALYMAHNTVVNERGAGAFLMNKSAQPAVMINNLLVGRGTPVDGPANQKGTLALEESKFVDRANQNFHLTEGAKAIDAGVVVGKAGGRSLIPLIEFSFPGKPKQRTPMGQPDIGAFEFGGWRRVGPLSAD